jgi:hypothetical protein
VFLNNRYHDPTLGRFVSVDPIVSVTHDAYGYGNNNPITYSDPSGLAAADTCERNPSAYGCGSGSGGGSGAPKPGSGGPGTNGSSGSGTNGAASGGPPPIPRLPNFDIPGGKYELVESVASDIGIDPIVLLMIYLKERGGYDRNGWFLEGWGMSRGVTNIQYDLFLSTYLAHGPELEKYGFRAGLEKPGQSGVPKLEDMWDDLNHTTEKNVGRSLAFTALIIKDSQAAFDAMGVRSDSSINSTEWALASYRFGIPNLRPAAIGTVPVGAKTVAEVATLRDQYWILRSKMGV